MIGYARVAHAVLGWLFVAAVVVQVFLAGLFIFGLPEYRSTHVEFGYTVMGLLVALVFVSALVARSRRQAAWSGLLVLLYVVQTVQPVLAHSAPAVAALHPVNALVLFALGVMVARRAAVEAGRARPASTR